MRIGVAGVGRIGTMHAAHLAVAGPGRRGTALRPGRRPRRARGAAAGQGPGRRHGRRRCSSEADGVLVATPTDTHPALVRACLAGRHTRAVREAHRRRPRRDDRAGRRDRGRAAIAGAGRLPAPLRPRGRRAAPPHRDRRARRRSTTSAPPASTPARPTSRYLPTSGGIFRDLLIHDLDAVPWLVGEPVAEVYASGSVLVDQAFADADDVDNAVVLLRFAGGAHAVLHRRPARPARLRPPHRGARRQGLGGRRARPAHAADLPRARRPAGRRGRLPRLPGTVPPRLPQRDAGVHRRARRPRGRTRRRPATAWSASASPRRASARGERERRSDRQGTP